MQLLLESILPCNHALIVVAVVVVVLVVVVVVIILIITTGNSYPACRGLEISAGKSSQ